MSLLMLTLCPWRLPCPSCLTTHWPTCGWSLPLSRKYLLETTTSSVMAQSGRQDIDTQSPANMMVFTCTAAQAVRHTHWVFWTFWGRQIWRHLSTTFINLVHSFNIKTEETGSHLMTGNLESGSLFISPVSLFPLTTGLIPWPRETRETRGGGTHITPHPNLRWRPSLFNWPVGWKCYPKFKYLFITIFVWKLQPGICSFQTKSNSHPSWTQTS